MRRTLEGPAFLGRAPTDLKGHWAPQDVNDTFPTIEKAVGALAIAGGLLVGWIAVRAGTGDTTYTQFYFSIAALGVLSFALSRLAKLPHLPAWLHLPVVAAEWTVFAFLLLIEAGALLIAGLLIVAFVVVAHTGFH